MIFSIFQLITGDHEMSSEELRDNDVVRNVFITYGTQINYHREDGHEIFRSFSLRAKTIGTRRTSRLRYFIIIIITWFKYFCKKFNTVIKYKYETILFD